MTEVPSETELRALAQQRFEACTSIYMPSHPVTPKARQDPIRFKNLLRNAREHLSKAVGEDQAETLLKPAEELLDIPKFWEHQGRGLAVFAGEEEFRAYRAPTEFDELVVVSSRFHLKPLLPLVTRHQEFYVLALDGNHPRLLQGNRYGLSEIRIEGMPRSMDASLRHDDPERQLQSHTKTPGGGGKRAAIFHGQGVGKDDQKDRLLRYFRDIDGAVAPVIQRRPAPVVLAAVDYYAPIYGQAETHGHVLDEIVSGSPDQVDEWDLHEKAWKIVEPRFAEEQQQAVAKMKSLGDRFSTRLDDIMPAAQQGRVETLAVSLSDQQWGKWDDKKQRVRLHPDQRPGDEDLLDRAAVKTFLNGGTVHYVEPKLLANGDHLAATLRS